MSSDEKITKEEEEGVKAIIFLQKLAKIDEPRKRALRNWRNFKGWEKEHTLRVYRMLST